MEWATCTQNNNWKIAKATLERQKKEKELSRSLQQVHIGTPFWMNKRTLKSNPVNSNDFLMISKVEANEREKVVQPKKSAKAREYRINYTTKRDFFDPVTQLSVIGRQSTVTGFPRPLPISLRPKFLKKEPTDPDSKSQVHSRNNTKNTLTSFSRKSSLSRNPLQGKSIRQSQVRPSGAAEINPTDQSHDKELENKSRIEGVVYEVFKG